MTHPSAQIIITPTDQYYPERLRQIPHPPRQLYVSGDVRILARPSLAVVGTRRPSSYGQAVLPSLIDPVIRAGVVIVSGLALGIDGIAHQRAVAAGAPTVAVLACGLDRIYPPEHRQLAEDILSTGGAIITEFPPGTAPLRQHFPQRNRILSGLAQAVLLVEAGEKSGALITAKFAVDQNRDVLALPGPITSPTSLGPNNWIKLGATAITSAADILSAFQIVTDITPAQTTRYLPTNTQEQQIIDLLAVQPLHVDELIEKSRLDNSVVSATLSLLEINGAIRHLGGFVYTLS